MYTVRIISLLSVRRYGVKLLLLIIPFFNAYGQATYMQRSVKLYMQEETRGYWSQFYQISSNSEVRLLENASFYCIGDSVRVEGTWNQSETSSVHFRPAYDNIQGFHMLKFHTSDQVVFRNVSFDGITATQGLLITDKSDGIVSFGNGFELPSSPLYLGSTERDPISDYINDVDKQFIMQVEKSIDFKNISKTSYIVTSAKSLVRARIGTLGSLKFPIGYSSSHFTPIEISGVSQEDVFDVAASPWMYNWDRSFVASADTTTAKNIKKNGIELMWYIKAANSTTEADVYAQLDAASPLIQKGYNIGSSALVRYIGLPDNQAGTALSKSYWDYVGFEHNTNTSIYPTIVDNASAHVMLRTDITNMDQYTIYSASTWVASNNYPLSAKTYAVEWGNVALSAAADNAIQWEIKEQINRISGYEIATSFKDIKQFPNEAVVQTSIAYQPSSTNYNWNLTPPSAFPPNTQYRIRPVPINEELDTLLYIYNSYYLSGSFSKGEEGSISIYENPVSIANDGYVIFRINTDEALTIQSVDINITSPTAIERLVFLKHLDSPLSEELVFSLSTSQLNLAPGLYVVVANVTYEGGQVSNFFNKFVTY